MWTSSVMLKAVMLLYCSAIVSAYMLNRPYKLLGSRIFPSLSNPGEIFEGRFSLRSLPVDDPDESITQAVPPLQGNPQVVDIELNDELRTSFMAYAMSTILSRALPDARDGMKPVHRRVLYAMHELNLSPDSSYRKCARVVGEVLGKYHPHGDQSVYDALVRMAQDFVMLHPLVSGHGNFGSVDNDPPAAMRYTEARLSSIAYETLLADIKEDTVDFASNFDGNEVEPVVLPARLPVLLINGASGIAVGMATNIPPHNLGEIADAIIALINDPHLSDEQLFKIIPAPDFPTGGIIIGTDGARKLYETGHGSVLVRAKTEIEVISHSTGGASRGTGRSRNAIVVTELPYMTNKAGLLEKIADLVNEKKLDGISDLRDETDRNGMRIVIELKRDAIPAVVQNNLFKKTQLQSTFSGNMLALVEGGTQPQRITLRKALEIFIKFRFETIRRRSANQLGKLRARDHVVEGMLRALGRIDSIIQLMKSSKDTAAARETLMSEEYGFSLEQSEAILSLTLRRLTAMEETKLSAEHEELTQQIAALQAIMDQDQRVYQVIVQETQQLKKKHGRPRQSVISDEQADLSEEDLLVNGRSVIMVTRSGYVKRLPVEEFEAQSRGGRGKAGAKLSAQKGDAVAHFFSCNDHDALLFITNRGIAHSVKAYQIPLASRTAKGVPLPQVLPIGIKEMVTSVIPIDSFTGRATRSASGISKKAGTSTSTSTGAGAGAEAEAEAGGRMVGKTRVDADEEVEEEYLVLLTSKGYVKKTPMRAFKSITQRGLTIISLGEGDALRWVRRCRPQQEVFIATRDGFATRFTEADLMATGRTSRGVRAIKLRDGDQMADMDISPPTTIPTATTTATTVVGAEDGSTSSKHIPFVLAVTERGYGKRIAVDEFRTTKRGGKGVIIMKFKKSKDSSTSSQSLSSSQSLTTENSSSSSESNSSASSSSSGSDAISSIRMCNEEDELVLSTNKGTVIRQRVKDISVQSRTATGVLLQKLPKDDFITMADVMPPAIELADL